MIITLSNDVNFSNLKKIIYFFQNNKYDSNNAILDIIKKENDEKILSNLINNYKNSKNVDYLSSGFIAELFTIFNNDHFCIKENKVTNCLLCGKKDVENLTTHSCFFYILEEDFKENKIFNIFLNKYKEKYSYYCECKKNNLDNYQSTVIKYNIIDYPQFLFIIFDSDYEGLKKNKDKIFNLVDDTILLGFNINYKLACIIASPYDNHFNTIIFNPLGSSINNHFSPNFIYYHDDQLNNGNIVAINNVNEWKTIGIPYILIYKKN